MISPFTLISDWPQKVGISACGLIIQDSHNRVALQLRDDFSHVLRGGQWCLFGGQLEPGETPEQATIREIREETDLNIAVKNLIPFVRVFSKSDDPDAKDPGRRLFVFRLGCLLTAADICVHEGAGFAFLTRAQVARFSIVPSSRKALFHFFDLK